MEGLSTYKTIQDIADYAVEDHQKDSIDNPTLYAKKIVSLYQSAKAPEVIKNNSYFMYLLEYHSGTVINEVIRKVEMRNSDEQ